ISYAGGTGNDVVLTRLTPPAVQSVTVNAGEAQRSVVRSLVVTFSTAVTFVGNPAAAFGLVGPGGAAGLSVAVGQTSVGTVVTLTFSGSQTVRETPPGVTPSLADGSYTLTVFAGQVSANSQPLAGGNYSFSFHRLFGDANGDRRVDA